MNIRYITYICCIYFIPIFAYNPQNEDLNELMQFNVPSTEMIESLRMELNRSVNKSADAKVKVLMSVSSDCKNCTLDQSHVEDPKILVFMSFSIPENIWLSLSKELQKVGGSFVIRGVPNNSFAELSKKLISLAKLGMSTPVQLDPIQFRKYRIESVPSFVVVDGENYHKISGNITVEYALKSLGEAGEK